MKLKALSINDLEQVREWRNQQLPMLRTPFPLTEEMQEEFYSKVISNRQANARFWGLWLDGSGKHFVGMTGIENIQWENRLAEISLLLNPEYSINEFLSRALNLVLDEGFNQLNLDNIFTEVYECSPYHGFWLKAYREYKGANFSYPVLPNRKYWGGKYYNSVYLNFTKEDFLRA